MNHYRTLFVGLAIAAVLALVGVGFIGCSRSSVEDETPQPPGGEKGSPREHLEAAIASLGGGRSAAGKDPFNVDSAQDAVKSLNSYLKALRSEKPELTLAPSRQARLRKQFDLTEEELAELNSSVFTLLDAYYLSFCFQLADVARSLDLQGMSTLDRARLAFDWVIRQVTLKERARQVGFNTRDDRLRPPQFVLQFGYGTAQERALVFLALLQQLGIDACMIVCPGDKGQNKCWLPGVVVSIAEKDRTGNQMRAGIYVFDTRLGIPLRGPGSQAIVRLDEVVKDPDAIRGLYPEFIREQMVPDNITRAQVKLVCPLSAMSPRMKFLERKMTTSTRVFLALSPEDIRSRCRKVLPGGVPFWSERGNPNDPTRVLRAFLFGNQRDKDMASRLKSLRQEQFPGASWQKQLPASLHPSLFPMFFDQLQTIYQHSILEPRTAMVRGKVDQTINLLAEGRNNLIKGRDVLKGETKDEKAKQELRRNIDAWCRKFSQARLRLNQLRDEKLDEGDGFNQQEELEKVDNELNELWRNNQPLVSVIKHLAVAETLSKESGFLHCLCIQERAERVQTRLQRLLSSLGPKTVAEAKLKKARINARKEWDNAEDGWRKFVPEYAVSEETLKGRIGELYNDAFQGRNDAERAAIAIGLYETLMLDMSRTVAARLLQARALQQSGKRAMAAEVLEEQQRDLGAWESNSHLEALKQFVRRNPAFGKGWPFTRPETISWLEASLAYELERLQRAK